MQIDIPDWKKAKYIAEMSMIADESKGDTEAEHVKADKLLCTILRDIGLAEIASEFERCEKWYS
jgi:hypothetical protein